MKLKRFFLCILSLVLSFSYLVLPLSARAGFQDFVMSSNSAVDETHGYGSQNIYYTGAGARLVGQIFSPSVGGWASYVSFYAKRIGTATGTYRIGVKNVAGGYPTGDFLTYEDWNFAYLNTTYSWTGIAFTDGFASLTSGTDYAVVIEPITSDSTATNCVNVHNSFEAYQPYSGMQVYSTSVTDNWTSGNFSIPTQDTLFILYGSSAQIPNTVETSDAVLRSAISGNYTADFGIVINPVFSDNVSAQLSVNSDLSSPITMYKTYQSSDNSSYVFSTTESTLAHPISGGLLPNTTYYYRGRATLGGVSYYSATKVFYTTVTEIPSKPIVEITKIRDLGTGTDQPYVFEITSAITTDNVSDVITNQGIQFSLTCTNGVLSPAIYSYNAELQPNNTFTLVLSFNNLAGYSGQDIYFRSFLDTNYYSKVYSPVVAFKPGTDFGVVPPTGVVPDINDVFVNTQNALGLTGLLGTYAFMGLLLLILGLVFGVAMFSLKEPMARNGLGVAWLLCSVAVVGGFLFTGKLGIWPIVILVGGLVTLILVVISVKLSGGGGEA